MNAKTAFLDVRSVGRRIAVWSEQREVERQAKVRRLLDLACEHVAWEAQVLDRYHALVAAGCLSEAIVALIQAGDLSSRPTAFWEAVQEAAEHLWVHHPWAVSSSEYTRRMEYLTGLRCRIEGWDC